MSFAVFQSFIGLSNSDKSYAIENNSLRTALTSSGQFYCERGPRCIDGRKARCKKGYAPKCVVGGNTKRPDCCKKQFDTHILSDPNAYLCNPKLLRCRKNTLKPDVVEVGKPFCIDGEIMCDSGKPSCDNFAGKPVCRLIQGDFITVPGCLFNSGFNADAAKCVISQ